MDMRPSENSDGLFHVRLNPSSAKYQQWQVVADDETQVAKRMCLRKIKQRLDFCANSPIMLSTGSDKVSVADTVILVFQTACHCHDKHPLLHKEQYS